MAEKIATRAAYGEALVALAEEYPELVVLDADRSIGYNSETLGKESRLHERDYSVKTRGAGA